jgi:hypothetical protein
MTAMLRASRDKVCLLTVSNDFRLFASHSAPRHQYKASLPADDLTSTIYPISLFAPK